MTQDQPQQPELEQSQQPEPEQQIPPIPPIPPIPTPPTPAPAPAALQSGKATVAIVQTLIETWKTVQPVLKAATVNTLRGIIWVSQGAVDKLQSQSKLEIQPPADSLPSAATLPPDMPLPIPGDGLPGVPPPPPAIPKPAPPPKPVSQISSALAIARTILVTLWQWWQAAIAKLTSLLPVSAKQKLPNNDILSAGIGTILLLFVWLNSSSSSPPAEAKVPPAISNPAPEIKVTPEVTPKPQVTPLPEIKVSPEVTSEGEVKVSVEVTPPAENKIAEETKPPAIEPAPALITPQTPKPVATVTLPPPVLTPEQKLLAGIQNKIAEITKESAEGLIQSVQANFESGQLMVTIGDDWYNFDAAKQDKLATDMWSRARELKFTKVEISDNEGRLIARSPVVGSNIIVLKR